MDDDRSRLAELCRRYGVLPDYHDVWGNRHEPPIASLKALLAELGVAVDGPLHELPTTVSEGLPAMVAITAGIAPWTLTVCVAGTPPATIGWTLIEENGTEHRGECHTAELGSRSVDADRGLIEIGLQMHLALPPGYHRLSLHGPQTSTLLIAAPQHCYQPPALRDDTSHETGRTWGPSVQLYALRSERNWGIGDYSDLAHVIDQWAELGAGIVGVNPLHAMFSHNPEHTSPYSPSSRQQLNTLYIDVEAVPDFAECTAAQQLVRSPDFQARLAALRIAEMVDYTGVAAAKMQVLRLLHESFNENHAVKRSARAAEFERFKAERGAALHAHATYEALQAYFHADDPEIWGWPVWPTAYRDPASAEVARFAAQHAESVGFFEYLQWQADIQLSALSRRCRERGMAAGLYLDFAVSVDRAGSDVWGHETAYARGATVGAPPDEVNPNGQGWGLPPLRPDGLRRDIGLFVQTLRATMRHSGAVRIDHVMGLMRLYWIPNGMSARDGAYVLYPLHELMAVVALESERNRCLVIGEDLGTVAEEMRAAMQRHELLSYKLLYFERDHGGAFKAAAAYPRHSLVAVSTHDLPTLAGWWSGHDLDVRERLHMFPQPGQPEQQRHDRSIDRLRLLVALKEAGLLPDEVDVNAGSAQPLTPALAEAIHAYAAETPSQVMVVQLEDALGLVEQANLPGTVNEHPNWRRKLPLNLDDMKREPRVAAIAKVMRERRPSAIRQVEHSIGQDMNKAVEPMNAEATLAPCQAIIPRATYRLQFHKDFTFDDAVKVLPYLHRLGISHVYCSPVMRARPGSLHGYDIVSHDEINPELGGPEGFERFTTALQALGMGQLLDVVPNHMGVLGADNGWWMDVLENGPASAYARYFDIDWHPVNRQLEGKVLVPVLGEHYGDVLASGQLRVVWEPPTDSSAGKLVLRYHDHRFPLNPSTWPEAVNGDMAATIAAINEEPSHNALHALHETQCYRLAYWRVAADEINYRRFFDINELAALRIEEPAVFEDTHRLALDLAAQGKVDGLRIDHPDGLHDPAQYFQRLQEGFAERAKVSLVSPDDRPARPLYVVAEKIAAPHEDVPDSWAIHGTTGYRFAMVVNGVLVDTQAEERFDRIWQRFSGERISFEELCYQGKRRVARTALASELTVLATALLRIARADRRTRDFTYNALRDALTETAACMPVYRTYVIEDSSEQDRRYIGWAIAHARRRGEGIDPSIFDFLARVLSGCGPYDDQPSEPGSAVRQFAARFQQFCAPVAAKGVEDTAFYRYHRLASLNEVGGDPALFGMTVRAFHGATADRAARWPHTILATSTHDNKRSEDVRNRIDVLSEMPGAWRLGLSRWRRMANSHRTQLESGMAPSGADEYLLYQTLLGSLPADGLSEAELPDYRDRIVQYALKAARESKRFTQWTRPDEDYENALTTFVNGVLARVQPNPLLTDLQANATALAWYGALNSLTMVLVKFTSPGVPDLYQGNELIDLSLVDPDNRRPVDYEHRVRVLDELQAVAEQRDFAPRIAALAAAPHDGRAKLWFTWRLLSLREQEPDLFKNGRYLPLATSGEKRENVLAYARQHEGQMLIVVTGRLFSQVLNEPGTLPVGKGTWGDTTVDLPADLLPPGTQLTNALTGEAVPVSGTSLKLSEVFAQLPAAALIASLT